MAEGVDLGPKSGLLALIYLFTPRGGRQPGGNLISFTVSLFKRLAFARTQDAIFCPQSARPSPSRRT